MTRIENKTGESNMSKPEDKEKIQKIRSLIKGCVDENQEVGDEDVKIGTLGTGVTSTEGGDVDTYPTEDRVLVAGVDPFIDNFILKMADKFKAIAIKTCHPSCGAGGAQGHNNETIVNATQKLVTDGFEFGGMIEVSETQTEILNGKAQTWFSRAEGPHTATHVDISIGLITGKDKRERESIDRNKSFDLSGDFIAEAINNGLEEEKAIDYLVACMKLMYKIAPGIQENKANPFRIFDGGRLDEEKTNTNLRVAQKAIEISNEKISQGLWKATGHH